MYKCNCCGHEFRKPEKAAFGGDYCGVYKSEICELCPECESKDIEYDEEYDEFDHRDRDLDVLGRPFNEAHY